jgi:hypothetical protein
MSSMNKSREYGFLSWRDSEKILFVCHWKSWKKQIGVVSLITFIS